MATKISHQPHVQPRRYYPLELPFSYQVLKRGEVVERGFGDTTQISSTHIKVKALEVFCLAATEVVMSISWPARLKDGTCLQLVVLAKLYRYYDGLAEFVILKHEFRTVSKVTTGIGLRTTFGAGTTFGMFREPRPVSLHLRPQPIAAACGA